MDTTGSYSAPSYHGEDADPQIALQPIENVNLLMKLPFHPISTGAENIMYLYL